MNNKKHFLFILLAITLCVTLVFTAFACHTDEGPADGDEETETLLVTNGDFVDVTGDTFPKSPASWTGADGGTNVPTGADNITAGVVDVSSKSFNSNRKKVYGGISNPSKIGEDDNILMIYNKAASSYKYTSSSITLEKNKIYKLSVNVKTLGIDTSADSKAGAYIYVKGAAYAAFEAVDTNGEWSTYETYIRSASLATGTITIELSLGTGNKTTGHMTKGHAFFDNIVLENLTDVEEGDAAFTDAQFTELTPSATLAKYDMRLADAQFDYASSVTSLPYTPAKYSGLAGSGSGDNALSSSTYVEKGIMDSSVKSTYGLVGTGSSKDIDITVPIGALGTRMLMIHNKLATAYGYRGSVGMEIAGDKYYAVSIYVRTIINKASSKKGATIKLSKGSSYADTGFLFDNIDTDGDWVQYTFYIAGNQFRSNSLYLEMWMGEGGKDDKDTHVQGAAFFDNASISEISKTDYDGIAGDESHKTFSLRTDEADLSFVDVNNFGQLIPEEDEPTGRTNHGVVDTANWAQSDFKAIDNPLSPTSLETDVMVINNFLPSVFKLSTVFADADGKITANVKDINPNSYYLLSVWIKTKDVPKDKGLNVSLIAYDKEKTTLEKAVSDKETFTALNSVNLEDYTSENNNGYTEVQFYIEGAELKASQLGLKLSFGSGISSQSSSHAIGYVFVSTITLENLSYSDYSAAQTGTTAKKVSMQNSAQSAEISANGFFNYINVSETEKLYKDAVTDDKNIWTAEGKLDDFAGVPKNWTSTDKSAVTEDGTTAGIVDINSDLAKSLGITDPDAFMHGLPAGFDTEKTPQVLGIKGAFPNLGYTSNTVSLSANSYYMFTVWAKSVNGALSIVLQNTSGTAIAEDYAFSGIQPANTDWVRYSIFVETGISSVSAKLSLYAGNNTVSSIPAEYEVYFTGATYTSIDKDAYDKGTAGGAYKKVTQSWLEDSFDTYTAKEETVSTPTGWTGSLVDKDASSDSEDLTAGVFNQTTDNWDWIGIDPDANETVKNAIFTDKTGNSVLVIDNKTAGAYQYLSSSASLTADTYYKISVWVLTYGLADDESATITLKVNNKTYRFGRVLDDNSDANDKKRRVNTSTYSGGNETIGVWQEYNFYVKTEKDVTASATMTLSLGNAKEENFVKGYLFADNYSVVKVTEDEFIARKPVEGEENDETLKDESLIDETLVPTNYRIVFTSDDANAEPEEEPTEEDENPTNLNWLWITTGVIGGIIVVVLIIYIIKKYAPKRKRGGKKLAKGGKKTNTRDKFGK